ncbi:putative DNA repair protein RAD16 [Triangularia setosa]|uniref:DNA repair protein RAD16 n=1 Tax=Triangularia setosa TaxID=2587417 RepID=A0AAN6W935_9PEZI|nr:putative DNA repair protein RAD16 [Podospora setosa]
MAPADESATEQQASTAGENPITDATAAQTRGSSQVQSVSADAQLTLVYAQPIFALAADPGTSGKSQKKARQVAGICDKAEGSVIIKTEEDITMHSILLKSEEDVTFDTAAQKKVDDALQVIEDGLDKIDPQARKDFDDLREAARSFGLENCRAVDGKWKLQWFQNTLFIGVSWPLACMSQNPSNRRAKASKVLVIAPGKLLMQWYRKIYDHCESKDLRMLIFRKANAVADVQYMNNDIMETRMFKITNYSQVQRQASERLAICEGPEESEIPQGSKETSLRQKLPDWYHILLDKVHAINNRESSTSLAYRYLSGKHRWVLTGTPMTNATDELQTTLSELTLRHRIDAKLMGVPIFQTPRAHPVESITVSFSPFELETYGETNQEHQKLLAQSRVYKEAEQPHDLPRGVLQKMVDHLHFFTSHPALVKSTWYEDQIAQDISGLPKTGEVKCKCFCRHCWRIATKSSKSAGCGHLFCESCFSNLKDRRGSCPSHRNMPSLPLNRTGQPYHHFRDDDTGVQPRFSTYQETTRKGLVKKTSRRKTKSKKRKSGRKKWRQLKKITKKKKKMNIQMVQKVQHTRVNTLEFLSRMLTQNGYRFVYSWGDLDQAEQEQSLKTFRKVPVVKIMLASVTCTTHGLSLTVANRAIIYNHWWNAISNFMDGMDKVKKRPNSVTHDILGLGATRILCFNKSENESSSSDDDEGEYSESDSD